MGRCMHKWIKEHDRDMPLSRTQTSAVSEHDNKTGHYPLWDEFKFIDRDPHWYSRWVRFLFTQDFTPDSINRESGIATSEAWVPMIRQQSSQ